MVLGFIQDTFRGGPANILPDIPKRRTVSQLKARLLRPATTTNYEFSMRPPGAVKDFMNEKQGAGFNRVKFDSNMYEYMLLACTETSLPGTTFATHDIVDDYTGVNEKHAYRRNFDDTLDATFYVDHDHKAIRVLENWMRFIADERSDNGYARNFSNYNYRMAFPDEYKTDSIYIYKFEKHFASTEQPGDVSDVGQAIKKNFGGALDAITFGLTDFDGRGSSPNQFDPIVGGTDNKWGDPNTATIYNFLRAFPISYNTMPISYDGSELLKINVSFSYSRYTMQQKVY